jgi:hypothetical protein
MGNHLVITQLEYPRFDSVDWDSAITRIYGEKTMNKVTLEIRCGNAAFEDGAEWEVARILRVLADKFESGALLDAPLIQSLIDRNGNPVGEVKIT